MKTTWESTVEVQFTTCSRDVCFLGVSWVGSHLLNDTFVLGQPRPINPLNTFKIIWILDWDIENYWNISINPNDRMCHFFTLWDDPHDEFSRAALCASALQASAKRRDSAIESAAAQKRIAQMQEGGPLAMLGPLDLGNLRNPVDELPICGFCRFPDGILNGKSG